MCSVGSRTSATCPLESTMWGNPAEERWARELLELTEEDLEGKSQEKREGLKVLRRANGNILTDLHICLN